MNLGRREEEVEEVEEEEAVKESKSIEVV